MTARKSRRYERQGGGGVSTDSEGYTRVEDDTGQQPSARIKRSKYGSGAILRALKPGQSVTFTRELKRGPISTRAQSDFSQTVGGYGLRLRPGCEWSYESFSTITTRGRILIGCIMTLTKAEDSPPQDDTKTASLWRVQVPLASADWLASKGPADKRARALNTTAAQVEVPLSPAALAKFLTNETREAVRKKLIARETILKAIALARGAVTNGAQEERSELRRGKFTHAEEALSRAEEAMRTNS
jgi:hypothetical protein